MSIFCAGIACIILGAFCVVLQSPISAVATFLFCGLACIVAGARSIGNKWEHERVEAILKDIRRKQYFEYGPDEYHQEHEYLQELEIDRITNPY